LVDAILLLEWRFLFLLLIQLITAILLLLIKTCLEFSLLYALHLFSEITSPKFQFKATPHSHFILI